MAVGCGHGDIVNDLLENRASIATKNASGFTPLHVAAATGIPMMVQLLLCSKGANIDAVDNDGFTPLLAAVHYERTPTALALLAAGADVSPRCRRSNKSVVHMAAAQDQVDILRVAIEHGADVNNVDTYGNTPLILAARSNNSEAIDVLVESGANITAQGGWGYTPLHCAAGRSVIPLHRAGHHRKLEAVTALLKHGADVNARDNSGETPLHDAARVAGSQGAAEVVDCLLRAGADETIAGEDGTAARWVGIGTEPKDRLAEEVNRVEELLANAPADRAWRRRGYLVLCCALPNRVQLGLGQDTGRTHTGLARMSPTGANMARTQLSDCSDTAGRNTVVVYGTTDGGIWTGVAARLLQLKEEDLFRTIVGYL